MNGENDTFSKNNVNCTMNKQPLISIITVCYNAANDIGKTLDSVLKQIFTDYEYIIVDGKSSDNTLNIILSYQEYFYEKKINVRWISERDSGIFDAMNKGVKMAKGIWINFLNAGDSFSDTFVLKKVEEYLIKSKADIVYGNCYRYHRLYSYIKIPGEPALLKQGMEIPHQASFIKRDVQKQHLFSMSYHLASDHDLFLKLYLQGYNFEHIPILVCFFSLEGASNTRLIEAYKETYRVLADNKIIDLGNISTKLKYIRGYVIRIFEMMLPVNLRWRLKAAKKKMLDKIRDD